MKPHQLCSAFPPMSDADFASLSEDIKANGLRDPITLYEGMVLDGWHRFQACAELAIEPRFAQFTNGDPASFVLSKNLHRRHLSASQRAVAVASCREWQPLGVVRKVADHSTEQSMAKEANVSPRTISDAKTAIKTGQKDDVLSGKISVSKAAEKAKPKVDPEPEIEPDHQPDIAAEFIALSSENDQLQKLNESLLKDDSKKEIQLWKEKFDATCGRVNQLLTTEAEMKKQLDYQSRILAGIRKELGVEKTSEILPAIKNLLAS